LLQLLISEKASNGNITKLTYDGANTYRVTSVTLAAGSPVQAVYSYTYNTGNTVVTDPNGHATTYYYDYLGRVTKVTDAAGNSFQTAWTADSHPASTTDAYGKVTSYGYDSNNNPTTVTLPTGASTSAVYGTVTNIPYFYVPTSSTDAQGNVTSYGYDGNGDLTTITDALASQNRATAVYNANGTVASATDFNGNTTSYSYDAKGNLTTVTPPAPLGSTAIVPDGLSRPASVTDGKGQKTSYTYDPLDRVTQVSYADGSTIASAYDADGNQTSMVDNTGATSYSYDAQNRKTQKTLPGGVTVGYGYDTVGNLTALTDSGGTVSYAYNAVNLPVTLTEPSNLGQTTFGYDANGQRTSRVPLGCFPGGVVQSQTYDASGRLATISAKTAGGTQLTNFSYSYTKPGGGDGALVSSSTDEIDLTTTAQQYDAANRLTSWVVTPGSGSTFPALNYQYTFDGNGNRSSINANGTLTTLGYNAANEWMTATSGGKTANYSYDANGNELGNDGFGDPSKALAITYNAKNQTASVTDTQQNVIPMTYTGPGQAERVSAAWVASNPDTPGGPATYTYGSGLLHATDNTGTAYYTRDPGGALAR
jgi:YD repeat-containing protein